MDSRDPVLALAFDPELNRAKSKTSQVVRLIQNFAVSERKVSRLCQLALKILQALEKMELTLKNWIFVLLDYTSDSHFDEGKSSEERAFNLGVSVQVTALCQELTAKLNKITADVDFVTRALRALAPADLVSDSGALLTLLLLRSIKLKDALREKILVAYLKAKLISMGTELEAMVDELHTVASYKRFVVCLLRQLTEAVDANSAEDKTECFAVISDMEQMFEVYKVEQLAATQAGIEYAHEPESERRDSLSSMSSSNTLQKSSITDELPYLLTAFSQAKSVQKDVSEVRSQKVEEPEPVRPSALAYLQANNTWLSRLGIRPQVVTVDLANRAFAQAPARDEAKENLPERLTKLNLDSHIAYLHRVED